MWKRINGMCTIDNIEKGIVSIVCFWEKSSIVAIYGGYDEFIRNSWK